MKITRFDEDYANLNPGADDAGPREITAEQALLALADSPSIDVEWPNKDGPFTFHTEIGVQITVDRYACSAECRAQHPEGLSPVARHDGTAP